MAIGGETPFPLLFKPDAAILFKADAATQTIWAVAALEEPDKSREVMDYATAVPMFKAWSKQFSDATSGKSLGNVRAMHNPKHLAGKVEKMEFDDEAKRVRVCLKILDPIDWLKVEEGGYTGLSIGGGYAKKWADPIHKGCTRYTPRIGEISLVDSPCMHGARFLELQKSDGSVEEVMLKGTPRTFAQMLPPPTFADLLKIDVRRVVGMLPHLPAEASEHEASLAGNYVSRGKTFSGQNPTKKVLPSWAYTTVRGNKPMSRQVDPGTATTVTSRGKTFTSRSTEPGFKKMAGKPIVFDLAKADAEVAATEEAKRASIAQTMHEHKVGTLRSWRGTNPRSGKPRRGPIVTDRKQAIAIALSQAGRLGKTEPVLVALEQRLRKDVTTVDTGKPEYGAGGDGGEIGSIMGAKSFVYGPSSKPQNMSVGGLRQAQVGSMGGTGPGSTDPLANSADKAILWELAKRGRDADGRTQGQTGKHADEMTEDELTAAGLHLDTDGQLRPMHTVDPMKQPDAERLRMANYMKSADSAVLEALDERLAKRQQPMNKVLGLLGAAAGGYLGAKLGRKVGLDTMAHLGQKAYEAGDMGLDDAVQGAVQGRQAGRIAGGVGGAVTGLAAGRALSGKKKPDSELAKPNYMQKLAVTGAQAAVGQQAVAHSNLSEKEHDQRIAAAKARWLKEGHHDLDDQFDSMRTHAGKAVLGRKNKVAAVDQQRRNTWHAVGDAQGAYDKVRPHLPKHANLMMEVSHAAGLLHNPEGVGEKHFGHDGAPSNPLYVLHPAEADDWIKKHGKAAPAVAKMAPRGLITHIREILEPRKVAA
jgi:hypothetical protein